MLPTRWRSTRAGKEEKNLVSGAQEKNKALVRRFLEAQANGELDTVKEMLGKLVEGLPRFRGTLSLGTSQPTRQALGYIVAIPGALNYEWGVRRAAIASTEL
jgi:hypothetical protein